MVFLLAAFASPTPQPGDLVFQTSRSQQSAWLQVVTHSRYTHVGLVIDVDGSLAVIEAVQPVQIVPLEAWIRRGVEGHVAIRRPTTPLTEAQTDALEAAARTHLGKSYDLAFSWDDDRIYCTELVAKAYQDALGWTLGERRPMASWNVTDPQILAAMRARGMDPNEAALAPVDLLNDPRLTAP